MKLIDNWKKAWKFTSVQVAMLLSILATVQASMPDLQAMFAPTTYALINLGLGIAVIIARVVKQSMEDSNGAD